MQALVDALGQDGAELIVTDTAPHSGVDAVTVAWLSDHILIPLQPSFPDLPAITLRTSGVDAGCLRKAQRKSPVRYDTARTAQDKLARVT